MDRRQYRGQKFSTRDLNEFKKAGRRSASHVSSGSKLVDKQSDESDGKASEGRLDNSRRRDSRASYSNSVSKSVSK